MVYVRVKEELEYQKEDRIIEERAHEVKDDEIPKHVPKKKWTIKSSCNKKKATSHL